jgi:hypothetical protein
VLVVRAIQRIFRGSAFRFTEGGILLGIGLTVAWIALASLGRAATLNSLTDEFGIVRSDSRRGILSSLIGLNFLRAALTLAAVVSAAGAILIASSFWASTHVSAADAARLWFLVLFLIWLAWTILNWLLSTAAAFVVIEREWPLNAISSTVRLCLQKPGPMLTTGTFFGLVHLGLFIAACGAGFTVLGALHALRAGPVLFVEWIVIIGYCAIADFLYTARMAAYVFIVGGEEIPASGRGAAAAPVSPAISPFSVDQGELILSDTRCPQIDVPLYTTEAI